MLLAMKSTVRTLTVAVLLTSCSTDPDPESDGTESSSTPTATDPASSSATASATAATGMTGGSTGTPTAETGSTSTPSVPTTTDEPTTGSTSTTSGPPAGMSFFVTSEGNGAAGGNYGGLDGADGRCQALAEAAGSRGVTWRAYLSAAGVDGAPDVHARDRIGAGPWFNAADERVAPDVATLHAEGIDPALMLDETGAPAGKGDPPGPEHDILTGSNPDGTLAGPGLTCNNWTSGAAGDRAQVGHHDWSIIPDPITPEQNFNSVHDSRCDEDGLAAVLGSGRLYCFAGG